MRGGATDLERRVTAEIERGRDELVALAADLIRFDTVAREPDDTVGRGGEAALQDHLAHRLRRAGLEVEVWEPQPEAVAGHPSLPSGLQFRGRPQLLARRPGTGGGRSLLLNGHIDVVPAAVDDGWSSDPFTPEVRDNRLYGRGACDMKGGVAAMAFAVEILARLDVATAGDILVNTVTDEESTGAGALAAVAHGVRADAGIVPEPTALDVWTACRGSVLATVTVPGRAGHAGLGRAGPEDGSGERGARGAVNAIDKAAIVLGALSALREEWRARRDHTHPLLGPGDIVPTGIAAGGWLVSHPAECRLQLHISYLPAQAEADGGAASVQREVAERLAAAAAADPWLGANPPVVAWLPGGVPPCDVSPLEPIVASARTAAADVGGGGALATRTTWFDGVTFTRAGTPTIGFGPGSIVHAHGPDEHVTVDDLVAGAQSLALVALRFCGGE